MSRLSEELDGLYERVRVLQLQIGCCGELGHEWYPQTWFVQPYNWLCETTRIDYQAKRRRALKDTSDWQSVRECALCGHLEEVPDDRTTSEN